MKFIKTSLGIMICTLIISTTPLSHASASIGSRICETSGFGSDGDPCTSATTNLGGEYIISAFSKCLTSAGGCVLKSCGTTCQCLPPTQNCPGESGGGLIEIECLDITQDDCPITWSGIINAFTGVETGSQNTLNTTTCQCTGAIRTVYRCGAGWYGLGQNQTTTPTCSRCPNINNINSTNSSTCATGSTSIIDCFWPKDTNFTADGTGTAQFTDNCSYSLL